MKRYRKAEKVESLSNNIRLEKIEMDVFEKSTLMYLYQSSWVLLEFLYSNNHNVFISNVKKSTAYFANKPS